MAAVPQDRRALVLYGSETGNAQDVAEELARIAERLRFHTEIAEFDTINLVCRAGLASAADPVELTSTPSGNCFNTPLS
jgi:sulfite reductase alpha subunit-like flavoprotein